MPLLPEGLIHTYIHTCQAYVPTIGSKVTCTTSWKTREQKETLKGTLEEILKINTCSIYRVAGSFRVKVDLSTIKISSWIHTSTSCPTEIFLHSNPENESLLLCVWDQWSPNHRATVCVCGEGGNPSLHSTGSFLFCQLIISEGNSGQPPLLGNQGSETAGKMEEAEEAALHNFLRW